MSQAFPVMNKDPPLLVPIMKVRDTLDLEQITKETDLREDRLKSDMFIREIMNEVQ